jgi:hypothetical protein
MWSLHNVPEPRPAQVKHPQIITLPPDACPHSGNDAWMIHSRMRVSPHSEASIILEYHESRFVGPHDTFPLLNGRIFLFSCKLELLLSISRTDKWPPCCDTTPHIHLSVHGEQYAWKFFEHLNWLNTLATWWMELRLFDFTKRFRERLYRISKIFALSQFWRVDAGSPAISTLHLWVAQFVCLWWCPNT